MGFGRNQHGCKEIVARLLVRKSYFNFVLYLLPMREKL